jgi:K+-transporting ATPase ATPase C chain
VPSDAVTASGSGLDPHISPAYARLQLPRVARVRNADQAAIQRLIDDNTAGRSVGFMGEKRINVVRLNLALDEQFPI